MEQGEFPTGADTVFPREMFLLLREHMSKQHPHPFHLKESRIVTLCIEVAESVVWWCPDKIGTSEIV